MTMKDDPVIAEIRRVRHELSEAFGHDPKRLVKFLQEQEKLHSERLVYLRCSPQNNETAIPQPVGCGEERTASIE